MMLRTDAANRAKALRATFRRNLRVSVTAVSMVALLTLWALPSLTVW